MKRFLMKLFFVILITSIININISGKGKKPDEMDYFLKPLKNKQIAFIHLASNKVIKLGSNAGKGDKTVYAVPFTEKYSEMNDSVIKDASAFYENADYKSSYNLLDAIKDQEKDNLIFLYFYARTLYMMENKILREIAFENMKKMKGIIDKNNNADQNTVLIDLWFTDIHLMLGNLNLEFHDYDNAVLEYAEYLYANFPGIKKQRNIYEQILTNLTEAYYFKNDLEMNSFFYKKTLKEFPGNGYVLNFKL